MGCRASWLLVWVLMGCADKAADGQGDAATVADTDADSDADTDSDTDADTDSDSDADTDSDSDADTDSDSDADTDSDTDADTDTDTAPTGDTAAPIALNATWTADPEVPTRVTIQWDDGVGDAVLSFTDDAGSHSWSAPSDGGGSLVLPGLPASSDVSWQLDVFDGPRLVATSGPHADRVADPPADLTPWTPTVYAPGGEAAGHWFVAAQFTFGGNSPSFVTVVDGEGRLRFWRRAQPYQRILRAHMSADGQSVLYAANEANRNADLGTITREPIDGSAPVVTTAPWLHHDFVEYGSGYAFLGFDFRDVDLGTGPEPWASDAIRVVEEGATGSYEEPFSFFDDWPDAVSRPCSHSRHDSFVPDATEWTHSNSLVAATDGDGWWILPRYMDQIARVRDDGTIEGILGGDTPTWTHTGDLPMAHGHFSQALDDDTLLVFSNGDHVHQGAGSKVVELRVDRVAGTVETVWETPEPFGRFTGFLGDAKRLPGGHTLIVNPNFGMYEVDAAGTLLWELLKGQPAEVGRVEPIEPWID